MLGMFEKKHPELFIGLDHDDDAEAVEPQVLPDYDHNLFEREGEDVDDNEVQ